MSKNSKKKIFCLTLLLLALGNSTFAASGHSYSSGFSSSRSSSTTSTTSSSSTSSKSTTSSSTPSSSSSKTSFGSFGASGSKSSAVSAAPESNTQSNSALSKSLDKSAANKNAMDALQAREARNANPQASNSQPVSNTTFGNSTNTARLNVPVQSSPTYSASTAPVAPASPQVVVVNNGNQASPDHFWTGAFLGYIFGSHNSEPRRREYSESRSEPYNGSGSAPTPATTNSQVQSDSERKEEQSSHLWLWFVFFTVAGVGLWFILKPKKSEVHYKL